MNEPMSDERLAEARELVTADLSRPGVAPAAKSIVSDLLAEVERLRAATPRAAEGDR